MTLSEEKAVLRQVIRTKRRHISDKAEFDRRLLQNMLAHPWMLEADVVLAYYSGTYEPDTHGMIEKLLTSGRRVALPVCDKTGTMQFCMLDSIHALQEGAYGIPEPSGREQPVLTERTLCIVPGLAFTESGERLGQGGGYYDRFLQMHPGLRTMGLTYQCLMQISLPCEAHDCRVDVVMTDGEHCFLENEWRYLNDTKI